MGMDGIGSSIVIALAALLWFVYLVPTWLRRREYLSTERNAVRLQQTLRIMAESAEVPREIHAEVTARSVAEQQRALRKEQQLAAAVQRAHAAAAARSARLSQPLDGGEADASSDGAVPQAAQAALPPHSALPPQSSLAARRLRRSRALASLILLLSLVGVALGVSTLLSTGAWVLLAASGAGAVGSFVLLGQMAAVAKARAQLVHALRATPAAKRESAAPLLEAEPEEPAGWTPVPLPRPLYLSRSLPEGAGLKVPDDAAVAKELLEAAREAERALRAAQASSEVTAINRQAPSRFASMGIVEETTAQVTDLDAVLRRRRAVG